MCRGGWRRRRRGGGRCSLRRCFSRLKKLLSIVLSTLDSFAIHHSSVHTPFPTFLVIITLRIVASRTLSLHRLFITNHFPNFVTRFSTSSHASTCFIIECFIITHFFAHTHIFTHGHIQCLSSHIHRQRPTHIQCLTSYESRSHAHASLPRRAHT